ncbi:uncharacterized protein LOC128672224 [Plodia interpunctella]|uniref:uncharacterized protein LOC128672224 n=1 Tax=Plodia interpunctella TaxID=58824 RepID=UPI00236842EE|nr:uncharacterized protein LOC128672224 [Plodia interpunctella]
MFFKITVLCFILAIVYTEALVKRDAATTQPNILESFQKNVDAFRKCVDQVLAKSVDEVNTKQIQPIFSIVGDQVNRVSKAFDDLTAPKSTKSPFDM